MVCDGGRNEGGRGSSVGAREGWRESNGGVYDMVDVFRTVYRTE